MTRPAGMNTPMQAEAHREIIEEQKARITALEAENERLRAIGDEARRAWEMCSDYTAPYSWEDVGRPQLPVLVGWLLSFIHAERWHAAKARAELATARREGVGKALTACRAATDAMQAEAEALRDPVDRLAKASGAAGGLECERVIRALIEKGSP